MPNKALNMGAFRPSDPYLFIFVYTDPDKNEIF